MRRKPWFRIAGCAWLAVAAYSATRLLSVIRHHSGAGIPWLPWTLVATLALCSILMFRFLFPRKKL